MRSFYQLKEEDAEQYIQIVSQLMDDYLGNILIFDEKDHIVFISSSTCRDLGCKREDVIGQHKSKLIQWGYTERSASELSKHSKRQEQISVKALKTNEIMFATSCPVFDENGNIIFVVNRSETEKDLLAKMDKIYAERFLLEQPFCGETPYEQGASAIIAKSAATRSVFDLANEIAMRDSTVMLNGEPGVGKEVLAKYIFQKSLRADKPFLSVNCSAIPNELMESEFFGYEKGSFTGANRSGKPGIFELANTGTLFLDEIGELPLSLQPKLLRVLDSGEFFRIGGKTPCQADVRIISATNRDLRKMVEQGLFREDLYYRLNVIPIKIPPLRERKEDICELANQFLAIYNRKYMTNKKLSLQTQNYLMQYSWPGNIRELKNMIERLATISKLDIISLKGPIEDEQKLLSFSEPETGKKYLTLPEEAGALPPLSEAVHDFELEYIRRALYQNGGNVSQTAKQLGIHRSAIYRKLDPIPSLKTHPQKKRD